MGASLAATPRESRPRERGRRRRQGPGCGVPLSSSSPAALVEAGKRPANTRGDSGRRLATRCGTRATVLTLTVALRGAGWRPTVKLMMRLHGRGRWFEPAAVHQ